MDISHHVYVHCVPPSVVLAAMSIDVACCEKVQRESGSGGIQSYTQLISRKKGKKKKCMIPMNKGMQKEKKSTCASFMG